eukprot:13022919-Alexandrium_andersonii.AAC.1
MRRASGATWMPSRTTASSMSTAGTSRRSARTRPPCRRSSRPSVLPAVSRSTGSTRARGPAAA